MKQIVGSEVVDHGVDWLTATVLLDKTFDGSELERATELAAKMLRQQESIGNKLRKFSFRGFEGMGSGGVAVGRSGRGFLFRLSGETAREHWRAVYDVSTNVSRLDVQTTIRTNGPWCDLTRVHQQEVEAYRDSRAPHLDIQRISSDKKGSTLNIGSRKSDAYGRIYDKFMESRREEYRDCWRYEVEFKRDAALGAAQLLADSMSPSLAAAGMASQWFQTRNISGPQVLNMGALPRRCLQRTDVAKARDWLKTAPRGSLAFLIERGFLQDGLNSLGLTDDVLRSAGYTRLKPAEEED